MHLLIHFPTENRLEMAVTQSRVSLKSDRLGQQRQLFLKPIIMQASNKAHRFQWEQSEANARTVGKFNLKYSKETVPEPK